MDCTFPWGGGLNPRDYVLTRQEDTYLAEGDCLCMASYDDGCQLSELSFPAQIVADRRSTEFMMRFQVRDLGLFAPAFPHRSVWVLG